MQQKSAQASSSCLCSLAAGLSSSCMQLSLHRCMQHTRNTQHCNSSLPFHQLYSHTPPPTLLQAPHALRMHRSARRVTRAPKCSQLQTSQAGQDMHAEQEWAMPAAGNRQRTVSAQRVEASCRRAGHHPGKQLCQHSSRRSTCAAEVRGCSTSRKDTLYITLFVATLFARTDRICHQHSMQAVIGKRKHWECVVQHAVPRLCWQRHCCTLLLPATILDLHHSSCHLTF